MPTPPGSGTLVEELATLKRRIDELARKGTSTDETLPSWRSMSNNAGTFSSTSGSTVAVTGWVDEPGAPTNTTSDISYASGLFTVTKAGLYLAGLGVGWSVATTVTGRFTARLSPSGAAGSRLTHVEKQSGVAEFANPRVTAIFWLDVGSTVEASLTQNSGASRTLTSSAGQNFYFIARLAEPR